jgi:hypothetical protein
MSFDPIDWFFGMSLFKQLALIFLTGPLVASVWALVADRNRQRKAAAVPVAPSVTEARKAA